MSMRRLVIVVLGFMVCSAASAAAQQVRGRVVDDRSRQAIRNASAVLVDGAGEIVASAETGGDGFFQFRAPGPGTYRVRIQQAGYAEVEREVKVGESDVLVPAFVLKSEAIALDSIGVDASAARREGPTPAGAQRASHIISGARMAELEMRGGRLMTAVKEMSSLRTREFMDRDGRDYTCVESVRAAAAAGSGLTVGATTMDDPNPLPECQWVVLVMDGMLITGDEERNFRQLHLSDFESVEYLPPMEAGQRYGLQAAATGALVLWSRGRGPHASDERTRRD